jgi:AcrR family transcriptional regulator
MNKTVISKREQILAAASAMILRNGLQCSMADVAREAGVAVGSIYHYFQSKDEMVSAIYGRLSERMTEALVVDHPPEVPHGERIRRYIADYIRFIVDEPDQAVLFEYLASVPPLPPGELNRIFSPITEFTSRLFSEAQEAGVLMDADLQDLGAFLGGGIRNTLKWRRANGERVSAEDCSRMAAMCWAAVRAR